LKNLSNSLKLEKAKKKEKMKYNQTPITNFNLTVPKKQTPITNFNLTVPKKQTKQQSYDCSQSLEMINNILNESFISNLKHNRKKYKKS